MLCDKNHEIDYPTQFHPKNAISRGCFGWRVEKHIKTHLCDGEVRFPCSGNMEQSHPAKRDGGEQAEGFPADLKKSVFP